MGSKIFDESLLRYAEVFSIVTAPMGDYAPRLRLLAVDFKNRAGADCRQESAACQNPNMTDEQMVELIQEQYASLRCSVSAITEVIIEHDVDLEKDIATFRCLYARPGFLEETMRASGWSIPADMVADANATGFHPVNWDELVEYWGKEGRNGRA